MSILSLFTPASKKQAESRAVLTQKIEHKRAVQLQMINKLSDASYALNQYIHIMQESHNSGLSVSDRIDTLANLSRTQIGLQNEVMDLTQEIANLESQLIA